MKDKYQKTIYACFIGYVVQAVVNNFVPLLFLTFEKTYGIPLSKITAKPFTGCVYRNSIVCYDLCDRRRSD